MIWVVVCNNMYRNFGFACRYQSIWRRFQLQVNESTVSTRTSRRVFFFLLKCKDRDSLYHQCVSVTVKCENQMERIFIISFPMIPVRVQSCHMDRTHLCNHFRPINKNRNSSIKPKFKIFQTTINTYFVIIMALEMILGNRCFITVLFLRRSVGELFVSGIVVAWYPQQLSTWTSQDVL